MHQRETQAINLNTRGVGGATGREGGNISALFLSTVYVVIRYFTRRERRPAGSDEIWADVRGLVNAGRV